jgi:hypothetical protein
MRLSRPDRARPSRPRRRREYRPELLEDRHLLSVSGVAAAVQSTAPYVPMRGTGTGVATLGTSSFDQFGNVIVPVTSTGSGNISPLGNVTITESHTTTVLASSGYKTSAVTGGTETTIATDGDELFLAFSGFGVRIGPGQFSDTFIYTITGGTGQFKNARGSGVIHSTDGQGTGSQVPFVFDLAGVISAGNG